MHSNDSRETPRNSDDEPIPGTEDAGPCAATSSELLELLEAQEFKCALTGRDLDPKDMHIDHIVPIRHGGQDHLQNLQWLCKQANLAKGSLSSEEFLQLCQDVVSNEEA